MSRLFVVGDVHGRYNALVTLLRETALIREDLTWMAGTSTLWFLGDLVDRGPKSIEVIDLVMRLQHEAQSVGGYVGCLLGNHEVVFMSAFRFGEKRSAGPSGTFFSDWATNGGNVTDLRKLTPARVQWLKSLPALAIANDQLLVHADATFYLEYGRSIEAVNEA